MLAYAKKVIRYCDGKTYSSFSNDSVLVEACVFNLSQLGELCRLIDNDFSSTHPEVPWKEMYGLRNRIVHDYEGVNLHLVWEIISCDLPELCVSLQKLSE